MMSTQQHVEITKRGMDAAFGYTHAAINASFETTARALAVWTEVARTLAPPAPPREETWEWSGAPRRPRSTLLSEPAKAAPVWPDPPGAFAGLFALNKNPWFGTEAPSPFAWWAWMPQSAVPATWPWAYGYISYGVPGSVAWPMAKANVALLEVAQKTAEATGAPFPAYRSDNGFASAQVWTHAVLATPAAALLWPWLKTAA